MSVDLFNELPTERSKFLLDEIIEMEFGTKNYTSAVTKGSNVGDNFIGVIYRILITIPHDQETESDTAAKEMHLIVKLPPHNQSRREQFFVRPSFLRETWVYDQIFPLFHHFQEERNINPAENGFHHIPKCYRIHSIEYEEALFMEDLKQNGFEMVNRFDCITFEHATLIMKTLSKFHAISFAIRDQEPEKMHLYATIEDVLVQRKTQKPFTDYLCVLVDRAIQVLNADEYQQLKTKMHNIFDNKLYLNIFADCIDVKLSEPYSVLCHGDCWNNNIMFKYDEITGKPIDVRLLDWQLARYSSPVCDITYFLFCCTSKEFRDQYYDKLINIYYEHFCEFLTRLKSDPVRLFPYEILQEHLRKFGKFGLLMAIMIFPFITTPSDDVDSSNLDEICENIEKKGEKFSEKAFNSEKTADIYKQKMLDVIEDMDKYGYI